MKLSTGIYFEEFMTNDSNIGQKHHAVSAILLHSCPSSRLREINIQGYPVSFLTKQIDLINTLYQPDSNVTYSIRYISHPHPASFSGGRMEICIFCKTTGLSMEDARNQAEDQTEQLLIQLCGSLPDYVWTIVTDSTKFQALWQPFKWDIANVIEIRRRDELVELDTIRTSRTIGFSSYENVDNKKSGLPVYYVHPFLPHPGQMERLLRMMLLHEEPLVYTATMTPVRFSPDEERAMLDEIAHSEGYQPDHSVNIQRIQEQRANMICQGLMGQMLRLQDAPFLITISIASPHPISKTMAEAAGVAVSASVGENPSSVYSEPSFIQMGGYDVIIPASKAEKSIARNNAATLRQDEWGITQSNKSLKRLRFMMDGHEASNAFRFPEDPGDGLPGINVHNQRMRSIPPELVPDPKQKLVSKNLLLGINTYLGVPQEVFLPEKDRLTHMYVVGQTGTGKTTLLKTMLLSDIQAGNGCALIDPHGDLFEEILGSIPPERMEDVIVFDPSDSDFPVGLNLLDANGHDEQYFVVREMQAIMRRLLEDQYGYYSKEFAGPVFYQHIQMNMLLAMSDPEQPGTLLQFYQIFQSRDYWKRWIPLKTDDAILKLWIENTLQHTDYTQTKLGEVSTGSWISGKFADFVFDPRLRAIFGQTNSSIDFQDVMNNGKILLINLAKGLLGESNSRFLGLVLMAKLQAEAMKRTKIPTSKRRPFFLYVDEFQSLATENFTVLLSEARKFGLGLVLANQFISQIKDERIIQSVFGNVGTFLSFRLGREDAMVIEPQFLPYFDRADLTNLPNWQIATKTTVHGRGLPPFTLQTVLPPTLPDPKVATQVREISRKKFNRPRSQVEEMIIKSLLD